MYLIPEHILEEWRSRGTGDSYTAIHLSRDMARTLLDSLSTDEVNGHTNLPVNLHAVETTVLSLANDL